MARTLLYCIPALFLSLSAWAQKNTILAGSVLGVRNVWVLNQNNYGQPEMEYRARFGTSFGLSGGYGFSDRFSIYMEIAHASQGQLYAQEATYSGTIYKDINLRYLQFPVLLRFTGCDCNNRFFALLGPQFGLLYAADIGYRNAEDFSFTYAGAQDRFLRNDLGIAFGLGMESQLTKSVILSSGLRTYWGLTDTNHPDWRISSYGKTYKKSTNAYWGVQIGIFWLMEGRRSES